MCRCVLPETSLHLGDDGLVRMHPPGLGIREPLLNGGDDAGSLHQAINRLGLGAHWLVVPHSLLLDQDT
jgi:hypothetical protein